MRGEPAPFDSSHCLYASQLQYRWMTLLLRIRRRASVGVSATLWADIPNFFGYRAGLFTYVVSIGAVAALEHPA
jgi:hypothetical protein